MDDIFHYSIKYLDLFGDKQYNFTYLLNYCFVVVSMLPGSRLAHSTPDTTRWVLFITCPINSRPGAEGT